MIGVENMKKINTNVYVGLGIAAFSGFILTQIAKISAKSPQAAAFPKLIVTGMFIIAAYLILTGFLSKEDKKNKIAGKDLLRVLAMFVSMLLYAFFLKKAGYVICTMGLLLIALLLFGNKNKIIVAVLTVLVPLGMYLMFTKLNVRLPHIF